MPSISWYPLVRRMGSVYLLLAFSLYIVLAVAVGVDASPAGEVEQAVAFVQDVSANWFHVWSVVLFAVWFFGGFAYGMTLLITGTPQRLPAALLLMAYTGFFLLALVAAYAGDTGVPAGTRAGRTDPLDTLPGPVLVMFFTALPIMTLFDLLLPPWRQESLKRREILT